MVLASWAARPGSGVPALAHLLSRPHPADAGRFRCPRALASRAGVRGRALAARLVCPAPRSRRPEPNLFPRQRRPHRHAGLQGAGLSQRRARRPAHHLARLQRQSRHADRGRPLRRRARRAGLPARPRLRRRPPGPLRRIPRHRRRGAPGPRGDARGPGARSPLQLGRGYRLRPLPAAPGRPFDRGSLRFGCQDRQGRSACPDRARRARPERDRTIPVRLARKLHKRAREPKEAVFIPEADHADLPEFGLPTYVLEFLARHGVLPPAAGAPTSP